MRIVVAGAGAGKTTTMASRIRGCQIPEGKVVYCVAFTNAAADNIRSKLGEAALTAGKIKVSTIHSFLYSELVLPFYHLLYDKRYQGISVISLPNDHRYHNSRIKELDEQGLLHQTKIPERAKWVVYKSSKDKALTRRMRAKVLDMFAGYCGGIYVDEAQDIDKDVQAVLMALDAAGIEIELHGDPKQDVKGHGCFRALIDTCGNVEYQSECHRCPPSHLLLSNTLASDLEQQTADPDRRNGEVSILFEADLDVADHITKHGYGLCYISHKNDRYETHATVASDGRLRTLHHEILRAIGDKYGSTLNDLEKNRYAYYAASSMIEAVANGDAPSNVVGKCINAGFFDYDNKRFARMCDVFTGNGDAGDDKIVVSSIEAIKGLESEKCLFILTTDLAPYLFGEKTDDNRTKHLLYVALTRSLSELMILVTEEVEQSYGREKIGAALERMLKQ